MGTGIVWDLVGWWLLLLLLRWLIRVLWLLLMIMRLPGARHHYA
jgi:hypothetical protein